MTDGTTASLRRPAAMALDLERCIDCGTCETLAPGILAGPGRIAITPRSLEAMALCPVGALHWLETIPTERTDDDGHEYADDA